MTTLHLGVLDIPYASKETKTTGDVAEILEAKYHVMDYFFNLHQEEIIKELEVSIAGSFESLMMGAPPQEDIHAAGTARVETMFKDFLSNQEMDGLEPGVPTTAALRGVSHRFKRPYVLRPPRPSFIDTGQYQATFKCWVD
jgi:hypothetical protein